MGSDYPQTNFRWTRLSFLPFLFTLFLFHSYCFLLISCVISSIPWLFPAPLYLHLVLLTPQICFHHCLCCLSEASSLRGASKPWLRKAHICYLPSWEQPAVYSKLHVSILFLSVGIRSPATLLDTPVQLLLNIANKPIAHCIRHVDMVKTSCWSLNWVSEWGENIVVAAR